MEFELDKSSIIESIADVLANSHDWLARDPAAEITKVINQNHPALEKGLAAFVAGRFMSLPLSERIRIHFNHIVFVRDSIREFQSN